MPSFQGVEIEGFLILLFTNLFVLIFNTMLEVDESNGIFFSIIKYSHTFV